MRTLSLCALVSALLPPPSSRSSRQIRSPSASQTTPCMESGTARICPAAVVGNPYVVQLNGEGGCGPALPYQYRVPNGSLPPGLALDKDGVLHGTPAHGGHLVLRGRGERRGPALGRVVQASEIGARIHRDGRASTSDCRIGLRSTGHANGVGTLAWSVVSGTLPPGLVLSPTTGADHWHARDQGTFAFKLSATDTRGVRPRSISRSRSIRSWSLATTRLAPTRVGRSYRAPVRASGSVQPLTFAILSGRLPTGLRLNSKTGVLSGKPRQPGTYRLTIEAQDGLRRTAKQAYTLTVKQPAPRRARGLQEAPFRDRARVHESRVHRLTV